MLILKYILVVIEVATSILLVGLILLQKTKSHGAGMAFGAAMGESLFGAQAGNVLTKTTIILTTIFLINTTVLALMGSGTRVGTGSVTDTIRVAPQPAQQPAGGLPGAQAPTVDTTPAPAMPAAGNAAVDVTPVSASPGVAIVEAPSASAQPAQQDTAATPAAPAKDATKDEKAAK